eukprot:425352-Amphidinium_carterae.1
MEHWMETNLSANGVLAAKEHLKIWNDWTPTSIQGLPTLPIGFQKQTMDDREAWSSLWTNSIGASTHAVGHLEWMEEFPCLENSIYLVEKDRGH